MAAELLDVRPAAQTGQAPHDLRCLRRLGRGESFVLVNNHDPVHLHDEFEIEHSGSYGWDYLERGTPEWRIQITKLATSPLPRCCATPSRSPRPAPRIRCGLEAPDAAPRPGLEHHPAARRGHHRAHTGPDLDVLIHVLAGSGELTTELDTIPMEAGALLWLPRLARRQFTAGPNGLSYLTVHQRRKALALTATEQP